MRNIIIVLGITVIYIFAMFGFPDAMISPGLLVQGHQDLRHKCAACHDPFRGIPNEKCTECHKTAEIGKVHDTIVSERKALFHTSLGNQKCTTCHSDHNGLKPEKPYGGFNHELLTTTVRTRCNSCHSKPTDKLHAHLSVECSNCHNTDAWKLSGPFDHAMIQGTDRNKCTTCHLAPEDDLHKSFKDNCSKCHSTGKWVPSTFDHTAYFRLDADHNAKCTVCHSNGVYNAYTCYGCHEHSQGNILAEHNEEGINDISKCVSCHKSADEHDIRMEGGNSNGRSGNEENEAND